MHFLAASTLWKHAAVVLTNKTSTVLMSMTAGAAAFVPAASVMAVLVQIYCEQQKQSKRQEAMEVQLPASMFAA